MLHIPSPFPIVLAATLAVSALSQQYVIDQSQGNDTFGSRSTGQTFTPSVGAIPGVGTLTQLPLTSITLYQGNSGATITSSTTWLKIYDGDPNAAGQCVAVSSNSVNTVGLSFHSPLHWDFAQVPLDVATEYWAVMSISNVTTAINVAEVSLETANRNIPAPNAYAGGSGLIANIAKHSTGVDTRFRIEFYAGVMPSWSVSGTGCPSSVGLATLSAQGAPQLGTTFQVDFANISPTGLPYAAVGYDDVTWQGLPLPYPLANLIPGVDPSCMVLVDVVSTLPLSVLGSVGTLTIALPSVTELAGLPLHIQGIQLEPSFGISLTAKGLAIVGN